MYPPDTLVRETVVADKILAGAVVAGAELFDEIVVLSASDLVEEVVSDTVDEDVGEDSVDVFVVVALALLIGKPEDGAAVGSSMQSQGSVPWWTWPGLFGQCVFT